MNTIFSRVINGFLKPNSSLQVDSLRFASKKASGGKRNPKQAKGNRKGWKKQDGCWVQFGNVLATQTRAYWLAGLNVKMGPGLILNALKEGRVCVTCEMPDLNYTNETVVKYFGHRQRGVPFFKKYFHVIPKEQHTRFKLIDQV